MASFLQSTPFQLDISTKSFKISANLESRKIDTTFCSGGALIVVSIAQYWFKSITSIDERVISLIAYVMMNAGATSFCIFRIKSREIVVYINSLFHFHSRHPHVSIHRPDTPIRTRCSIKFVECMLIWGYLFPVVITYGFHWTMPFKTSLVGYWFLSECSCLFGNQILPGFTKAIIFLVNHWMWALAAQSGMFELGVIVTMSILCLGEFVET